MNITVEELAELAMESEIQDPIDWGMLSVDEKNAYRLMASHVLEQFEDLSDDRKMIIVYATITKLLVENFVLNIKMRNNHENRK
jgi:hypothetical protein